MKYQNKPLPAILLSSYNVKDAYKKSSNKGKVAYRTMKILTHLSLLVATFINEATVFFLVSSKWQKQLTASR